MDFSRGVGDFDLYMQNYVKGLYQHTYNYIYTYIYIYIYTYVYTYMLDNWITSIDQIFCFKVFFVWLPHR